MTLLAKILVFVNVALSFVMFTWALALFTNRIDWTLSKAKADQPAGKLAERQDRVKEKLAALDVANTRWREALRGNDGQDKRPAHDGLPVWEKRRVDDRAWYAEQLKAAQTGDGMGGKVPIKRVSLSKEGQPIPDAAHDNRPTMVAAERRKDDKGQGGGPLFCYDYYVRELGDLTQQIQAKQAEYQQAVKEASDLTEETIDKKDGGKGLRHRIIDEQEKLKQVNEELKDVGDRQTNSQVETELLLARRAQLERRIAELKKAP
jgi:hypothetical protein